MYDQKVAIPGANQIMYTVHRKSLSVALFPLAAIRHYEIGRASGREGVLLGREVTGGGGA